MPCRALQGHYSRSLRSRSGHGRSDNWVKPPPGGGGGREARGPGQHLSAEYESHLSCPVLSSRCLRHVTRPNAIRRTARHFACAWCGVLVQFNGRCVADATRVASGVKPAVRNHGCAVPVCGTDRPPSLPLSPQDSRPRADLKRVNFYCALYLAA